MNIATNVLLNLDKKKQCMAQKIAINTNTTNFVFVMETIYFSLEEEIAEIDRGLGSIRKVSTRRGGC